MSSRMDSVQYKVENSVKPPTLVRERIAGLATPAFMEGIRGRVASALSITPRLVNIESQHTGYFGWILRCLGTAAGTRFFAKIFLVDPYPIPPRFATPGEELARPEKPQRPVEEQIAVEWEMVREMRSLVGTKSIPAPLGRSVEDRILVFEGVNGMRMDRFVNWSWPDVRKVDSVEAALFQAGAWLRTVHEASFQGYETIDFCEVVDALRGVLRKKKLETTGYADLALNVLESTRQNLNPRTSLRVPVALNHGDFSLPNLIWDHARKQLWVIDFELSSYRPILHDLCTMIFTLQQPLLRPLTSARVVQLLEEAFWRGYGPVSEDTRALVSGLACARLFYHSVPRISTLRERRGWTGGVKATLYKRLLQPSMIARILRVRRRDKSGAK